MIDDGLGLAINNVLMDDKIYEEDAKTDMDFEYFNDTA